MKKKLLDLNLIEEMAAQGCYQKEIAECLGISIQSWHNYLKDPELEVFEAYKRGVQNHRNIVMGGLTCLAKEKNPTALIFLAKAHFGRRENIDLTVSGNPDAPLETIITDIGSYAQMTSEERRKRIKELEEMKKLKEQTAKDAE